MAKQEGGKTITFYLTPKENQIVELVKAIEKSPTKAFAIKEMIRAYEPMLKQQVKEIK